MRPSTGLFASVVVAALLMGGASTAALAFQDPPVEDPIPPDAPADLAVSDLGHLWITVSWSDPSGGVTEFVLERRIVDGAFELLENLPAGTTEWTDFAIDPATTYEYRVRAVVDGLSSAYSGTVMVASLPPLPQTPPGALSAQVLSATTVSLAWEDRSDSEIEMQVFRAQEGGLPVLVTSLPAGSTAWVDNGTVAQRTYTYTVRCVGVDGPSAPSAPVEVSTPATLVLEVLKGKRIDSVKASRDSIDATLELSYESGGSIPDPRTTALSLGTGPVNGAPLVSIPAGDLGWKERKGVFTWKSPKGSFIKATVVVDPVQGTVRLKVTRLQLTVVDPGSVRVWIRCGIDAGSVTGPWDVQKPGTLVL